MKDQIIQNCHYCNKAMQGFEYIAVLSRGQYQMFHVPCYTEWNEKEKQGNNDPATILTEILTKLDRIEKLLEEKNESKN